MTNDAEASHVVAALDLGGTHVSGALVDVTSGQIVANSKHRVDVPSTGSAEEILAAIITCANQMGAPARAPWGIAVPGPFDYANGVALFADGQKFAALRGRSIRDALSREIRASPREIRFINDAHAFLLGEWTSGSALNTRRCVGITLGTGLGSAFLADGTFVTSGPAVPPAGEVYQLRFHGRPIEDTVSRQAIITKYNSLAPNRGESTVDVIDIARLARGGDAAAAAAIDCCLGVLGEALYPFLAAFRADVVVVGGSISQSWDLVEPALLRGIGRGGPDPVGRLAQAANLEDAPLVGASAGLVKQDVISCNMRTQCREA